MKIKPIVAWYDFWVGLYYNKEKRRLYVMVPFVGFYLSFI